MVMDATQSQQPSPQSVGREFVRQYYTLLNKAPNHLHRFYNNNSSFIHGESTLVVGQKNIHNRIQQLNFHDCHAKISQVDAQATLGNGVVVQVTGELSNDGQPMRRFTQTFVLAAQSPKKYYVHNDIFRYQDMYSDEDIDGESRSENDEEHEIQKLTPSVQSVVTNVANDQQAQVVASTASNTEPQQQPIAGQVIAGGAANAGGVMPQQPAQTVYYSLPAAGGRPMAVLPPPPPGVAAVPIAAANFANSTSGVPAQQAPAVQPTATGVSQLNGVVAHDEIISNIQPVNVAPQTQLANQATSPVVMQQAAPPTLPVVANASILNAQAPVGITGVPVANAAAAVLPQNMQNFQQSPIIQTHILQQQQQAPPPQQPLSNATSQHQQQSIPQQQPHQQSQTSLSSAATMTVVDVEECTSSNSVIIPSNVEQASRPSTAANVVASGQTVSLSPATVMEPSPAPVVEDFKTINEQQQQEKYEAAKQQQQQQNEPKTYANLFKSTSSSPSSFVNAAMQQQQQIQQQQQQQQQQQMQQSVVNNNNIYPPNSSVSSNSYTQSSSSNTNSMSVYGGNRSNDNNGSSVRQDNNNGQSGGGPLPQRSNSKGYNKDFDQRRTSNIQFGDNQQLFLGNIPHHASEEELKTLFSRFGTIVDLRILSKSSGKIPPGGRNPLNYGFITYNDPEAVQNCLANCPLYFPENSPDGQKLNVEEKKPRARPNDMPPRQNMGGSGMNNINNNQRNMTSGGPPSRSLSNSGSGGGSMMRGNNVVNNSNNMSRGGGSSGGGGGGAGPRMGGAFNRNDNRTSNGGNGSQMRGGNNNSQAQGNSYGVRR